ncbi:hypothetical protein BLOT_000071 [Blomia tropicalis]|nr:hypothetical protein BLOT_000071 [Blomia tropicalis]
MFAVCEFNRHLDELMIEAINSRQKVWWRGLVFTIVISVQRIGSQLDGMVAMVSYIFVYILRAKSVDLEFFAFK